MKITTKKLVQTREKINENEDIDKRNSLFLNSIENGNYNVFLNTLNDVHFEEKDLEKIDRLNIKVLSYEIFTYLHDNNVLIKEIQNCLIKKLIHYYQSNDELYNNLTKENIKNLLLISNKYKIYPFVDKKSILYKKIINSSIEININDFNLNKSIFAYYINSQIGIENYKQLFVDNLNYKELVKNLLNNNNFDLLLNNFEIYYECIHDKDILSQLFQKSVNGSLDLQNKVIEEIDDITFQHHLIIRTTISSNNNKKAQLINTILNKYSKKDMDSLLLVLNRDKEKNKKEIMLPYLIKYNLEESLDVKNKKIKIKI